MDQKDCITHLRLRMAQRNVTWDEIELVLAHGQWMVRSGAEFFFLGHRQLPKALRRTHARLAGTTVVVVDGEVATVYRNQRGAGPIRRKPVSRWQRQ